MTEATSETTTSGSLPTEAELADQRHARSTLRRITIIATIGALAFGYDTGVISGALPYLIHPVEDGGLGLNAVEEGLVSASLILGAAFGALIGGRLSDAQGRRNNLLLLAVVFFIGAIGSAVAPNVALMVVARLVLGFAVGGASATVPLFIAEFAPAERRGRLVSQNELMIVTGQLVAYTSNAVLANTVGDTGVWRLMLGIAALPAAALFVGMIFVPESPRWLASKGRMGEALAVLKRVRSGDISLEWNDIQERAEQARTESGPRLRDISEPWERRIFVIGVGLGIVFQLTGVNAIMYYAPSILASTGLGTTAAITATIANGVVAVASTFFGIFLVGRIGRRPMLLTGIGGIIVSQILLGVVLLLPASNVRSFATLGLMLVFLFFMQSMVAVVCWLMLSEMFPLRYRGLMMGVAIFAQWLSNTAVTFFFPILSEAIGGYTFFVFAVINVGTFVFLARFLPETAGRSLEEFETALETGAIPIVSADEAR